MLGSTNMLFFVSLYANIVIEAVAIVVPGEVSTDKSANRERRSLTSGRRSQWDSIIRTYYSENITQSSVLISFTHHGQSQANHTLPVLLVLGDPRWHRWKKGPTQRKPTHMMWCADTVSQLHLGQSTYYNENILQWEHTTMRMYYNKNILQ